MNLFLRQYENAGGFCPWAWIDVTSVSAMSSFQQIKPMDEKRMDRQLYAAQMEYADQCFV